MNHKINRTKLLDRAYHLRDARLYVIATEGRLTEKQYFSINIFHSSRIKIEVLSTGDDNKSAPKFVIDRLDRFKDQYDLQANDSLWLMLDVDRWGDKNLREVCQESQQKNYNLAISNPCFEVWLYLHFDDLYPNDQKCSDFEKRLRDLLGSYNKANLNLDDFKDHIESAVTRAKNLHLNDREYWPNEIGSHVYRVVEQLLEVHRKEITN